MIKNEEPPYDLRERTKLFGLWIVWMFVALPKTDEARILGKQVLRPGASVGPITARLTALAQSPNSFKNWRLPHRVGRDALLARTP